MARLSDRQYIEQTVDKRARELDLQTRLEAAGVLDLRDDYAAVMERLHALQHSLDEFDTAARQVGGSAANSIIGVNQKLRVAVQDYLDEQMSDLVDRIERREAEHLGWGK